ncbi:NAD(P)-binding protein [Eremomyces bilateralis CBS 781.70]|uniref:NAD(P)-binding protein n=1 Tax=Eremomyces bilateralis CBS 781.70 TaxID=1392243 RepID=A0A6G1G1S5_9PEZI|nr:NAD(P)-binding protein [Eremomyces bilateralis CBS 781.70]KAF1811993.1 NAD(P)-binding protein [Eremomyces bilateralis CBS 781.70]
MVNIAVAGGRGQVSREVIDALVVANKHDITILSRTATKDVTPGVHWRVVDYNDASDLIRALKGVHTLLSFVQPLADPDQKSQKNLIDAAVSAGVKRFAPSEYGSSGTIDMPWWAGKEKIRKYLKEVNKDGKVLEYILFQPGLFLDYLAFPYKTAKHVAPLQTVFDYQNRRAIVVDGHEDAVMTLTTAADVAAVVAQAVDYDGEWPIIGGIRGNRVTFSQILEIGEKVRDGPFAVEKVQSQDLEAGDLKTSWALEARHQAVSENQAAGFLTAVPIGILLSSTKGAWDVSDELNQLFPDYEFVGIRDFLANVWDGRS